MEIDFLLIGQGLAGTVLGYRLKQQGSKILIIDQPNENNSSRVAAGLYNPVTGRKMVKTWKADQLFPEIVELYQELEELTGCKFLRKQNIYRPFLTIEEQNEWMGHSADPAFEPYLEKIYQTSQSDSMHDRYGGVMLKNCGWLDINPMLDSMKEYFQVEIIEEAFDEDLLVKTGDHWKYKSIQAKSIVYCNGLGALKSRFFGDLPFAPVKGEILELRQAFSPDYIVNRGVFRVNLQQDIFRVGSTYSHSDLDTGPTESAKIELLSRLEDLISEPVRELVSHKFGIRPATRDRKPFLGKHPKEQSVYMFNGFGAKGVSLIPYFSKKMIGLLLENKPLEKEVDIARYFNYI